MRKSSEEDIRSLSIAARAESAPRICAATAFMFTRGSPAFALRSDVLQDAAKYWRLSFDEVKVAKLHPGEFMLR